jgi:non-ribosomal peptide synthetase component F
MEFRMVAKAALQWVALRALHEGAAASLDLLANATGRSVASMNRRAEQEAWRDAEAAAQLSNQELRLRILLDQQITKAEAANADDEGSASADKARMDAISAVMRTLEKIGEITRSDTSAKENQTRRDANMATVLRRIDERIVELAIGYAKQLGNRTCEPG